MYKKVSKKCAKTTTISYFKNKISMYVVQKQYETFNVQVKRMQGQKNKVAI